MTLSVWPPSAKSACEPITSRSVRSAGSTAWMDATRSVPATANRHEPTTSVMTAPTGESPEVPLSREPLSTSRPGAGSAAGAEGAVSPANPSECPKPSSSVLPGAAGRTADPAAGRSVVVPSPSGFPATPVTVTATLVTPSGTTNVCPAPVSAYVHVMARPSADGTHGSAAVAVAADVPRKPVVSSPVTPVRTRAERSAGRDKRRLPGSGYAAVRLRGRQCRNVREPPQCVCSGHARQRPERDASDECGVEAPVSRVTQPCGPAGWPTARPADGELRRWVLPASGARGGRCSAAEALGTRRRARSQERPWW